MVPEGDHVSTAILNEADGSLIQGSARSPSSSINLWSITIRTGMPKLFASDMSSTDRVTGQKIPARIGSQQSRSRIVHRIYHRVSEDGG